jgi:hypothetical protein
MALAKRNTYPAIRGSEQIRTRIPNIVKPLSVRNTNLVPPSPQAENINAGPATKKAVPVVIVDNR